MGILHDAKFFCSYIQTLIPVPSIPALFVAGFESDVYESKYHRPIFVIMRDKPRIERILPLNISEVLNNAWIDNLSSDCNNRKDASCNED